MKIIFLNCWYAKAGKPFFDFIEKYSETADIISLFEVQPDLFKELSLELKDFNSHYEKSVYDPALDFVYGQSVFWKKGIDAKFVGRVDFPSDEFEKSLTFSTYFEIEKNSSRFLLANIHGKSRPGDKLDTPARIKQSQCVLDFTGRYKIPKIIGGDFNLLPDTKSVKMFEDAGYRNLIKDFGIKETRNKLAWDQFNLGKGFVKQHFADYCFVSPEVKVVDFCVPNIKISDHLPLILQFRI